MENNFHPNTPPAQSLPPSSPAVSPSANLSKTLLLTILGLTVVASSVFVGIQIGISRKDNQEPIANQATAVPTNPPTQTISPAEPTAAIETISPSSAPTVKIKPLSTEGWKQAQNNGVFFKIPANATCNSDTGCTEVSYPNVYQGKTSPVPARIFVKVTNYLGGSRRSQYLSEYQGVEDCKPIYVETEFGSVNALQIAVDGGWCQGGYAGGTVAVIGKKFVVIGPNLTYSDNKEISRWKERDTLISTLSSQ